MVSGVGEGEEVMVLEGVEVERGSVADEWRVLETGREDVPVVLEVVEDSYSGVLYTPVLEGVGKVVESLADERGLETGREDVPVVLVAVEDSVS